MQKILVTTDFSVNSKAGCRFAIQLATQHKFDLTFFHCYEKKIPTSWSVLRASAFEKQEIDAIQLKLDRFVLEIYKQMNIMPKNMSCVIKSFVMTNPGIREYAWENKFDYICISTRGAGKLKRIFGTNTSNLINFSEVPVIAVPYSYRTKKVASIMYASDLTNLESELKKVVEFAKPLKAKVELLHFSSPSELSATSNTIESAVKSFSKYNVKLHIEKPKLIDSMVSNLESAIKKSKPSMMIMFIEQNRSFFERLFLPSKSAEYSFEAKVPLLVYSKT